MGCFHHHHPSRFFGALAFWFGKVAWFLMAADHPTMEKWMTAINAEIHDLFINMYNVPEDNFWSEG